MPLPWWASKLSTVEDPISLEPLRTLRYPPFECRADPSLPHGTESDWYDGRVLAMYLISTANFVHPVSRRELTRDECVDLDRYCVEHKLCAAHVAQQGLSIEPRLRRVARVPIQDWHAAGGCSNA